MATQKYILLLLLVFMACQASPLSPIEDMTEEITASEKKVICDENSTSGECALLLSSIEYNLPDKECQVYDLLIEINTKFKAPAGLKDGSKARVDWEFFPKGNAGFWTMPIEDTTLNEGTIRINGCFTYGEQDTLKITRTITDHNGVESNAISIDIPRPKQKSAGLDTANSGFEVVSSNATITY